MFVGFQLLLRELRNSTQIYISMELLMFLKRHEHFSQFAGLLFRCSYTRNKAAQIQNNHHRAKSKA